MTIEQEVHGGAVMATAEREGLSWRDILDFSANINPLGLPAGVEAAIAQAIPQVVHYPDASQMALRSALFEQYQVKPEQMVLGNGASELLYLLCYALHPNRVLIATPTFIDYTRAAEAAGAMVSRFRLSAEENFALDEEGMSALIPEDGLLFVCNPNNPTGQLSTRSQLRSLIAAAQEKNCLCVIDESFLDFVPQESEYSCRFLLPQFSNLLVLRSLTKFYALPGLRLGVLWAAENICDRLERSKDCWNVNALAQAAGVAALADKEYRERTLRELPVLRENFYQQMQVISGWYPLPGAANFLLVKLEKEGWTAARLKALLQERHILIRDCSNFSNLSGEYVRLAVRTTQENEQFMQALREIWTKE